MTTNLIGITNSSIFQNILSIPTSDSPISRKVLIEHFMTGNYICIFSMFESDTIQDVRERVNSMWNVHLSLYTRRVSEELSDDTTIGALGHRNIRLYGLSRGSEYFPLTPQSIIPSPLIENELFVAAG